MSEFEKDIQEAIALNRESLQAYLDGRVPPYWHHGQSHEDIVNYYKGRITYWEDILRQCS